MSDIYDIIRDFDESDKNEYILLQNMDHDFCVDYKTLLKSPVKNSIQNYAQAARESTPEHISEPGLLLAIWEKYAYREFLPDDFEGRVIADGDIIGFHEMWEDTKWYYVNDGGFKRLWNFPDLY